MTALRVVLLGDGAWATRTLERLQSSAHQVAGVVLRATPSEPSLAEAAIAARVPMLAPERINAPDTVLAIREMTPDVLLSVAYNQILREPVRAVAPRGALNIHAGKLPFYRGRNILNWALINGETEIGVTAHFMDDGIDTGDIVLQRTLPVGWTDTYGDLLDRVVALVPGLAVEALDRLASGTAELTVQRHQLGTYFGGRTEGDEWLDWSEDSVTLHNKIRAITHPGPGARTELDGRQVTIWRAYFDPAWPRYRAIPGQVVGHTAEGALVKTGDSTIRIESIAVEHGPETAPRWPVGTRLAVNRLAALLAREQADVLGGQA
jgi:methionyl-tRNA formyltransferase